MRSLILVISVLIGPGCRCGSGTVLSDVTRSPETLDFGSVYVGEVSTLPIVFRNGGRSGADVTLATSAPFSVTTRSLPLPGGAEETVSVSFTAESAGAFSGVLTTNAGNVILRAVALVVPDCVPSSTCREAHFDPVSQACVESARAEGSTCQTSCFSAGACASGECVGEATTCADLDVCTIDVCGARGCRNVPRVCPGSSNPCRVAVCEAVTGCALNPAPDGTVCGVDDCLAMTVDVCVAGQCTQRARPPTGRCANTWVTTHVAASFIAFDAARGVAITDRYDTWAFDGQRWLRRTPTQRPSRRGPLAYDSARQRVVSFACDSSDDGRCETWEWDGVTWVQRSTAAQPRLHGAGFALVYDPSRARTVLFGGETNSTRSGLSNQTWEWDGRFWVQRTLPMSPPETAEMAATFDPRRECVVVQGGTTLQPGNASQTITNTTWEFDGQTWTRVADGPLQTRGSMSFDSNTGHVLLQGGFNLRWGAPLETTWAWTGTSWQRISTGPRGATLTSVPDAGVLALDGKGATWLWNGQAWLSLDPYDPLDSVEAATWDDARQGIVTWNDSQARLMTGTSVSDAGTGPTPLRSTRLFYDEPSRRTVAVGEPNNFIFDPSTVPVGTWTWAGGEWEAGATTLSFNRSWTELAAAMFDRNRQVGVIASSSGTFEYVDAGWVALGTMGLPGSLIGAGAHDFVRGASVLTLASGETFERLDGGAWQLTADAGRSVRSAMAFDEAVSRVVLLRNTPNGTEQMLRYDGRGWQVATPSRTPSLSEGFGVLVYDRARTRLTYLQGPVTWVYLP